LCLTLPTTLARPPFGEASRCSWSGGTGRSSGRRCRASRTARGAADDDVGTILDVDGQAVAVAAVLQLVAGAQLRAVRGGRRDGAGAKALAAVALAPVLGAKVRGALGAAKGLAGLQGHGVADVAERRQRPGVGRFGLAAVKVVIADRLWLTWRRGRCGSCRRSSRGGQRLVGYRRGWISRW
jgi:hypothetical protein